MKQAVCPRCGSKELIALADGNYKCTNCGYIGSLGMDKSIVKK